MAPLGSLLNNVAKRRNVANMANAINVANVVNNFKQLWKTGK